MPVGCTEKNGTIIFVFAQANRPKETHIYFLYFAIRIILVTNFATMGMVNFPEKNLSSYYEDGRDFFDKAISCDSLL